jgi:hypothetical protein
MKKIYRQSSSANKPWAVYEGTEKLGSFQTIADCKKRYPDAETKTDRKMKEISMNIEVKIYRLMDGRYQIGIEFANQVICLPSIYTSRFEALTQVKEMKLKKPRE